MAVFPPFSHYLCLHDGVPALQTSCSRWSPTQNKHCCFL